MSVIFIDDYLERVSIESLLQWIEKRESVSKKQLVLGQLGWKASTAQTPELMFELAQKHTSVLPFLQSGLLRLFEEIPAEGCGLTRTEHSILVKVRAGVSQLVRLFSAVQAKKSGHFMGDWTFQKRVRELVEAPQPLLEVEGDAPFYEPPNTSFPDQVFREFEVGLTGLGIEVLDNVVGWNAKNREHFGLEKSIFIPAMTVDKTRSV